MKLEYRNGVRISILTHEMSPLERAIQSYEEKAEKYYSMDNPNLHFTKEEREIKKKEAMRELAIQRRHLETIGEVHALLEAYLSTFPRSQFVKLHNENQFDEVVSTVILPIHKVLAKSIQIRSKSAGYSHLNRRPKQDRYMANKSR